jgi:hypothetical protein
MKKFLFVCAIAAFAACNNSGSDAKATDTTAKMSADTTAKMADTTAKMMAVDSTKKDSTTKK